MLAAISLVLYLLLEFPMLPAAPYLKMDFSDVPAAFGAVMFGPVCGLSVELIKNILEMLIRGMGTQMGFGNLQNFLIGCAYVLPYALLYRRMEGREIPAVWKMTLPCAAGNRLHAGGGLFQQLGGCAAVFPFLSQQSPGARGSLGRRLGQRALQRFEGGHSHRHIDAFDRPDHPAGAQSAGRDPVGPPSPLAALAGVTNPLTNGEFLLY